MDFLQSPTGLGMAAAVAAVIVFTILRRRKPSGLAAESLGAVDRLAQKGDYAGAAGMALREGKLDVALEYYLRAQQLSSAAHVAQRMGNYQQAAELYEQEGETDRAIALYRKAGMTHKADALGLPVDPGAISLEPLERADSATVTGGRASELAADFRLSLAKGATTEVARAELQRQARVAADALLAEGELRGAADLYRDAGLEDEAIHLYVNVLGVPGEAAPILAARGNHTRAAELYELAGHKERAAAAWVHVAHESQRPDSFVDRIVALSEEIALQFLASETAARPLTKDSVELHYRYATTLVEAGSDDQALSVFKQIQTILGPYKDVEQRLKGQRRGPAPRAEPVIDLVPVTTPGVAPAGAAGAAGAGKGAAKPRASRRLSEHELRAIAMQVARAAAEQLNRTDDAAIMAQPRLSLRPASRTVGDRVVQVVGLEHAPLKLSLVDDEAVDIARVGPSISTLKRYIGGRGCDLQNIEVYYRLGLAHLAEGNWAAAMESFDAVEEASPAYRDAYKRADQIRDWKRALGPKVTAGLGVLPDGDPQERGRYRLHGELGRGGMAVVYRGTDTLLGREVALKFLSEEFSTKDDMREMFQREARSVAQLNHPNIVTIHDFGVLEGRAFICMEYVEGKAVEQLLSTDQGLTIVESCRIIKQALDGLTYAHGRKIIHRDIKPANMMRTTSGLVKLMDFGLAKSLKHTTKASFIAGTPAYMPPEQLSGGHVDYRTDIFALGVTFYEMLTAKLPFEGLSRDKAPMRVRDHVPAIPQILDEAVMKAIALDPNHRYQSAPELIEPIDSILEAVNRFAGRDKKPAASKKPAPSAPTVRIG